MQGGCRIKKFHLEFKNKNIGEWNTVQRTNFSRVFILNTTMGTKYDLRISLENEGEFWVSIFARKICMQNIDFLMIIVKLGL